MSQSEGGEYSNRVMMRRDVELEGALEEDRSHVELESVTPEAEDAAEGEAEPRPARIKAVILSA